MECIKKIRKLCGQIIVTLRFSILSIFISLFVISSIIVTATYYMNSSRDIIYVANKSMHDITQSLNQLFLSEIRVAEQDAIFTSLLMQRNALNTNDASEMISYFFTQAEQFNIAQAIYWGDVKGNYVSAEYENDHTITSHYIDRNARPPYELAIKRDRHGKVVEYKKSGAVDYDPRARPWFKEAEEAAKPVWTRVYLYKPSDYLGITLAAPVYDDNRQLKGVLGVDIRLDWISAYINKQYVNPHGVLFIVQENGDLIAYPHFDELPRHNYLMHISELPDKWIPESFTIYKNSGQTSFSFQYDGKRYLANYRPIPMLKKQGWLTGIVVPENDFISQLNETRITNILMSLLALLIGIYLVSILVNNIVNPVKRLIRETARIKEFDLDGDGRVASRIKEVLLLSDAIYSMKSGLRAFKRYVPSELVRQLVKRGESAKLGGSKKQIVALFSDIKNFTNIMHTSDPDQLASQMNEYFDVLSSVITHEGGTIDKYIGDSIMAFWGAPNPIQNPCHHAAEAALKCLESLAVLEKKWESEGKIPLKTRIGIHYGEAIVGNFGSSERINYTAIGDTINIAKRLESLNKKYHTHILVSETVYSIIQNQYIFKSEGRTLLKGLRLEMEVYSLLGRKKP
ncbi:Adenylate cyclase 1 [Aquicella siphonis]|uniref:Adenylate cyclase 1 n=1 Tax=Aquicella siphonis TaxID=254247 RepID=A0A5E4PGF3_9COXI|nr:adenylate/guanylate cyclase domain-containing protein [Aquicella siphonis]VVC75598.1 Adenylate cyclase 1 [Aquicella siphonis]